MRPFHVDVQRLKGLSPNAMLIILFTAQFPGSANDLGPAQVGLAPEEFSSALDEIVDSGFLRDLPAIPNLFTSAQGAEPMRRPGISRMSGPP